MSSEQPQKPDAQNSLKSITAAFDLETKIRLIIQQVLTATMRKISQFHQKVQGFQRFFFTYKQRMDEAQEKGKTNQQSLSRFFQTVMKNKQNSQNQFIKVEQKHEKLRQQKNQLQQQIKQLNKKILGLSKQNQNIVSQFSKSKGKFFQYQQKISALKEQVAWKITKYIQQTAQTNKFILINNQKLQNQYFNINLSLKKNLQKYQQIISTRNLQESLNQKYGQSIQIMQKSLKQKGESLSSLNKKLQQMDTALYAKIKLVQSKLQRKIQELWESNAKIQQSVVKVQKFSLILQEVREDSQKIRRQLMKKFQQSDQKHTEAIQKQVLGINMNVLNFQKSVDKKIKAITQFQQKNIQHFNQKIEYLKIQLQSEISSKATKMLEEKSKNNGNVAMNLIQQIQQKVNKVGSQTKKELVKMQSTIKQARKQMKTTIQQVQESVQIKVSTAMKIIEQSAGSGVNPQFLKSFNQRMQKITDSVDFKLNQFLKQMNSQGQRIKQVQIMKAETEIKFRQLTQQNGKKFTQLQQKISSKVQRILFTVTKMRGDSIIRNQFVDKQLKQLKRMNNINQRQITTILKIFPAIGECINLMMCLIFDAEFQHSRVIQQNNPNPAKITVKFQNLVQGTLYQYMQKKKLGFIQYRHKEQNKTQIVKATFNAYNQLWQEIFTNDFKNKIQFMPKNFYKRYVQKNMGIVSRESPGKEQSQSGPATKDAGGKRSSKNSLEKMKLFSQDSRGSGIKQNSQKNSEKSNQNMNRSFHIRKKKISTIKSKDDLIMVVQQDVIEQK